MKKIFYTMTLAAALGCMQANAANNFSVSIPELAGKPGETVNVELQLTSEAAVAGYQVTITADKEGLELGDATVEGATTLEDAWIGSYAVTNKSYNLLCYSQSCMTYASNTKKTVAVIPVTIPENATAGEEYSFSLGNCIISDANGTAATCTMNGSFKITVQEAGDSNDINGDGTFDIKDVQALYFYFNQKNTDLKYDINNDGKFDIKDVQAIYYTFNNKK